MEHTKGKVSGREASQSIWNTVFSLHGKGTDKGENEAEKEALLLLLFQQNGTQRMGKE